MCVDDGTKPLDFHAGWSSTFQGWEESTKPLPSAKGELDGTQLCTTALPAALSSLNDFFFLLLPAWSLPHNTPRPPSLVS